MTPLGFHVVAFYFRNPRGVHPPGTRQERLVKEASMAIGRRTNRNNSAWMDKALCAGLDEDHDFYTDDVVVQQYLIGTVCANCPVKMECLNDALEIESGTGAFYRYGIWGGLTPEDRWRLASGSTAGRPWQGALDLEPAWKHGTIKGFHDHLNRREPPCGPCSDARANEIFNAGFRRQRGY